MARRFGHRNAVRGPRRMTSWLDIEPAILTLDGASIISHAMTAVELAKRPFTVVRTHLVVRLSSDQLASDEIQIAAVGLAVVSDQAVAVGVTAVPTPFTDAESDLWFVHQWMLNDMQLITAAGFDGNAGQHYIVDSKAMRKVEEDTQIIIVGESAAPSSGTSILIAGRLLVKEH